MARLLMGCINLKTMSKFDGKKSNAKYTEAAELVQVVPGEGNTGYLVVKPYLSNFMEDGKEYRVKVRQEDYDRNEKFSSKKDVKFRGYKIDKKMQAAFEEKMDEALDGEKNIVVLENISRLNTIKEDGETIDVYECSFIHNIQPKQEEKFQKSLVSLAGYRDSNTHEFIASSLLNWGTNPQSINLYKDGEAVDLSTDKTIKALKIQFEEAYQNKINGDNSTTLMGFEIAAVIPNPSYDENSNNYADRNKYITIYDSGTFDYIPTIKENMDGERFIEYVETITQSYIDWFAEEHNDLMIELSVYHVYPISRFGKQFTCTEKQTGSPVYQMITSKTKPTTEPVFDEETGKEKIVHKMWGAFAFVDISKDLEKKVVGDDGKKALVDVPSNFVSRLFTTGSLYHIRTKIKLSNGESCGIHAGLGRISDKKAEEHQSSIDDVDISHQEEQVDEDEQPKSKAVTPKPTKVKEEVVDSNPDEDVADDIPF